MMVSQLLLLQGKIEEVKQAIPTVSSLLTIEAASPQNLVNVTTRLFITNNSIISEYTGSSQLCFNLIFSQRSEVEGGFQTSLACCNHQTTEAKYQASYLSMPSVSLLDFLIFLSSFSISYLPNIIFQVKSFW